MGKNFFVSSKQYFTFICKYLVMVKDCIAYHGLDKLKILNQLSLNEIVLFFLYFLTENLNQVVPL